MGPFRGLAVGGVAFGVFLLVAGVLLFLIGQDIISFQLNLETICAFGLLLFGVIVLGATLYGYRMARGGWRRWVDEDWERGT